MTEQSNFIKAAYDEQLKYVLEAIKHMPIVEPKPLTRKQKLKRKIRNKKYELGKKFLAIANSLGAYNDDY